MNHNKDKAQIDQAMTVYFKAPKSFTGEDVLEIHCHGSRAVIEKILSVLSEIKGCRMAERCEFTRRAVYHNKMDLTSAEGLIDLISSDTQQQRQWALRQMGGELQRLYDSWRQILVHNRAYLEAFIDFPEEEIPPQKMNEIEQEIQDLIFKIQKHLDDCIGFTSILIFRDIFVLLTVKKANLCFIMFWYSLRFVYEISTLLSPV